MAELALAWYSMADDAVTANRGQVARWADELGFPTGRLSRANTVLMFRQAAREIQIPYESGGKTWLLFAEHKVTDNFELYTLFARPPAGKMRRLGEVKLFTKRRTARGLVPGSERVKTLTAASANDQERQVVEAYLATFRHRYEELQGLTPQSAVRGILRDQLIKFAISVGKNKFGLYFVYVDDLPKLGGMREFLDRCAPGSSFIALPIEAGPEQHQVFADAADDHMETLLLTWDQKIMTAYERPPAGRLASPGMWNDRLEALATRIAMHENRLGWPLLKSRAVLETGRSTMLRLVPIADLQRVIK